MGLIFVVTAFGLDPQKNCNDAGECAPWLVPIAFVLGALVGLGGLGQLMANPRCGSCIDPDTGDLVWWKNRFGETGGDEARIAPSDISLIRIIRESEGSDTVHLYNQAGERQFYFDEEVIPANQQGWVDALTRRWPHIRVDVVE